jgi:hypothetical protein
MVRRKGDVSPDWIIAVFIFVIFVSWSFQYYSTLYRVKSSPLDEAALAVSSTITSNITLSVYDTPVSYVSPIAESNSVMYAGYYWTSAGEKNTTMVLNSASSQLSCKIDGNTIYWQANVVAGENNFTIRVSNRTASVMNCTGTFSTTGANVTIPRASDRKIMLSSAALDAMVATNYTVFKADRSINRDFRLTVEPSAGSVTNYGSVPPNASNVFAHKTWYKVEEGGASAVVSVLVW